MKNRILLLNIFFTLIYFSAICQEKKPAKLVRNEIGIAYSFPTGSQYLSNRGLELVYTNWKSKSIGLRLNAGFTVQDLKNTNRYTAKSDTAYNHHSYNRFNYFSLGTGLIFQRHFYKRLFLTSAMDTRFMYANNNSQTSGYFMYKEGEQIGSGQSHSSLTGSAFRWELNPSVGVKLQSTHFSMALEVTSQMASMFMPSGDSGMSSQFDFKMGYNFTRLCFNYRF